MESPQENNFLRRENKSNGKFPMACVSHGTPSVYKF